MKKNIFHDLWHTDDEGERATILQKTIKSLNYKNNGNNNNRSHNNMR